MRSFFFFTLLCCALSSFWGPSVMAQTSEDFIGEWEINEVVLDVGEVPPNKEALVDYIRQNLEYTTFEFQEDHYLNWDVDFPDLELEEAYWTYNSSNRKIYVREWNGYDQKAGKTLVSFFVEEEKDGRVVFIYAGFIAAKFYVTKVF